MQGSSETPVLQIRDLHKSFASGGDSTPILRGVSLQLAAHETVALSGESGSGKSTLLHLAAGLDRPDRGSVTVDGTALETLGDSARAAVRRRQIGLIFQQFNLIPSLDVAANIAFQARLAGCHDSAWTQSLAARLGLEPHLRKYPEQLSGGQQQRVAIGRALAVRPRLLLADEPTGSLDEATGAEVFALLTELARDSGAALLMVTHSSRLAGALSRHLVLREGRLQ